MPQIFISYSRKDIGFVRKLAGDLEKAGYDVWWDLTDLRGGDDWPRVIPAAIEASQFIIVVLSPNSLVSDWVAKEYTQALDLRKRIIPIMLKPSRVPFALNTINYIDFTSDDYAASFNNLLVALGYAGDVPVVPAARVPLLLRALRKYAIPIGIGALILLALLSSLLFSPLAPSTLTPSIPPPTTPAEVTAVSATETTAPTATQSPTPSQSATITRTPTLTLTSTETPTLVPSPTSRPLPRLGLCVQSDVARSINVRLGPSSELYAPFEDPLPVGTCLFFGARNEESTWLQIAPNQQDSALEKFAGGWIWRDLLGLGPTDPINLPAVTLTPVPTPSDTPTITPTFTRTSTATATATPTNTPSPTATETPIDTPTETPTP